MNFVFFVFNTPKRLRVAFSFLWGGDHLKGGLKRGLKGGLKGNFKVGLKGA